MSYADTDARHLKISRFIDVTLSATAIFVLAPMFALVSLCILIETGRPIIYRQTRFGLDGRKFQILKFRKFRKTTSDRGSPLTLIDDERMTRIGGILARSKLDELPQLVNILRGDMAFVGPRPESLDFADCFNQTTICVLKHRPGLFGPSQIAFRNECALYPKDSDPADYYRRVLFPAKFKLDQEYYPNRTVSSDIRLLFDGALAVLGVNADPTGAIRLCQAASPALTSANAAHEILGGLQLRPKPPQLEGRQG